MRIPRKLLSENESVVVSTRRHAKALIGPLLLLMVIAVLAGFVITYTHAAGRAAPLLQAVVWGIAALAAYRWVMRPFLVWLTTSYTLTNQRVITRYGTRGRRSSDTPLDQVTDVSYDRSLLDRVLGCGTIVLSLHGRRGVELRDVPQVEHFHHDVEDLIADAAPTRAVDRRAFGEQ